MNRIVTLLIVPILLFGTGLYAQQRFDAALVAGINIAQIHGDSDGGYNKLGIRSGVRGIALLGEKTELSLDILYSQRGSTNGLTNNNTGLRFVIDLDYIEVPLVFSYKDWFREDHYKLHFSAGVSYGRLFNTRVVDYVILDQEQVNFAQNDLSLTAGLTFFANRHWGISAIFTRSVTPLYNNQKHLNSAGLPRFQYSLWGYFLSFQTFYRF